MGGGRRTRLVTALAVLVATAACTIGGAGGRPRGDGGSRGGGLGRNPAPSAQEVDKTVRDALKDVERYWSTTFGQIANGRPFIPVKDFHPYTRSQPPPPCGQEQPRYQPNAFYCPAGDFIAWDAEVLVPTLYRDFGPLLVAVVLAHEYGHAIQVRLRIGNQPTIVLEQQADCFAGAWVGDVRAGRSKAFPSPGPEQLDNTTAGLLMLRDQPGTPAVSRGAHGNAFDRVRAFQEGFEQNAERCARYRADDLPVTEVPFGSRADAATGGNLPYEDTIRVVTDDLQAYWDRTFPQLAGKPWDPVRVVPFDPRRPPSCGGKARATGDAAGAAFYCAQDGYVAFDGAGLGPALHERIGDNGLGMLLAGLFAQAVQDRRGKSTQGRAAQVAIDCLAGTWAFDLLQRPPGGGITLSPGDLDEAVAALLALGRTGSSGGVSAFERIAAFRDGVLKGTNACG